MVTTITSQRASILVLSVLYPRFILRWVLPHLFLNPSSSPCIEDRQAFPCLRDIRIQSKCSWWGIFSLSLKLNQWLHHVSSVASFLPCHYNTPSIAAFPSLHSLHYPHPFPKKQPLSSILKNNHQLSKISPTTSKNRHYLPTKTTPLSGIIKPWMKRKAESAKRTVWSVRPTMNWTKRMMS